MRRIILIMLLVCTGAAVAVLPTGTRSLGAPLARKHCTVVHRHGKHKRVCRSRAASKPIPPTATRTPRPAPTQTPSPTPTPTATSTPEPESIKTVFLIMLENHNWADVQGNSNAPYLNDSLLPQASYATRYFNPPGNHPSLRNYLWIEAGQCFTYCGPDRDPSPSPDGIPAGTPPNALHDLLTAAGISWREYAENMPAGVCPLANQYPYAARHNPFVYFNDVNGDTGTCLAHERNYSDLAGDLAANTVARYNMITPNLCDDGHDDCAPLNNSIAQVDTWLSTAIPPILASRAYADGGAIFITWDEGEGGDGPIGMIVLSPEARGGGYHNAITYTHSSLLRTFEEIYGVRPFLGDAQNATDLSDLFRPGVIPSG